MESKEIVLETGWHRLLFSQMQAQKPKMFSIFLHLAEQQSINIPLSTDQ